MSRILFFVFLTACTAAPVMQPKAPEPPKVEAPPEPKRATVDDLERLEKVWWMYARYKEVELELRVIMAGGEGDLEDARACLQRAQCEVVSVTLGVLHDDVPFLDCRKYRCLKAGNR